MIAQEEVFGPVLTVLRYRDDDDAVAIANNSQYGLSGAVWGGDVDRAVGVARRVRTGSDRRKRLHPRRCAVRRVQAERTRPRGWRTSGAAQLYGAEGHRNPGVMAALEGLRVVEIAGDIAGPYCTKLLVDLGADVTKIEPPSGDPLRRWGPFPGGIPDPNKSGLFEYLNAGKRGATVDLDSDALRASELISQAHLLVDGLRPGTLDRVGLGRTRWRHSTPASSSCASPTSGRTDRCATAMPRR